MTPGVDDAHAHIARKYPAWTTRPGGRAPRAPCPRSSLVLGVLVLTAVVSTRWVRLNLSPSVPYGLYQLVAVSASVSRGDLVVLPVPASVRAWQWRPLLKPVAAIAGDAVCFCDEGLWIAGQWYGPILPAASGKPLPQLRGCIEVRPGQVFLASQTPRTLDGRYFGVVSVQDLTAQAIPLWTWR